ncbi:MAG: YbgC/FadM family acyl-CoA thioesterase [Rubrivivax sp.]
MTEPTAPTFRHVETLRVRWAEVDAQRIVFNAHYLMYVDTVVAGWWRAMALPYPQAVLDLGVDLYVRKATLEYEAPARCDDRIAVGIRCGRIGRSSLTFEATIHRGAQRLVRGDLVYVCADPVAMQSRPIPAALREVFEAFEAGEAMLSLRCGDSADLLEAAQEVLAACPEAADATAPSGLQVVVFNRLGRPVSCGWLATPAAEPAGSWCVGGLWTLPELRGAGHGAAVLQGLLQAARSLSVSGPDPVEGPRVVAEVPPPARALFERAGFRARGAGGVPSDRLLPMQWMT